MTSGLHSKQAHAVGKPRRGARPPALATRARLIPLLASIVLLAAVGPARPQGANSSAQQYLANNDARREIFVRREMKAQSRLVERCAPEADAPDLAAELASWIRGHPQWLKRNVQVAFTEMVMARCPASDEEVGEGK